jgi:polyhydroxyalkanoate synthesis regulator phasin
LEDEETSRSSSDQRRYTEEIERLEQQLEDLRGAHDASLIELRNLRRNRGSHQDKAREAEAGFHLQQGEITQREAVITKLKEQVDKMRGDSINLRVKLEEQRSQRSSLRKD